MNSKILSVVVFTLIVLCGSVAAYYQKNIDEQRETQLINSRLANFSEQLAGSQRELEERLVNHLRGVTRAAQVEQAWRDSAVFLQSEFPALLALHLVSSKNEVVNLSFNLGQHLQVLDLRLDYALLRSQLSDDRFSLTQPFGGDNSLVMQIARQDTDKNDTDFLQVAVWDLHQWLFQSFNREFNAQRLFDLDVRNGGQLVFSTTAAKGIEPLTRDVHNGVERQISLGSQPYTLTFYPKPEFHQIMFGKSSFNLLVFGSFAVATLMFILIRFDVVNRKIEQQSQRDQQRLRQEFKKRKAEQTKFRSSIENLANILNSMQITIITIDEGGTVTFINDFTIQQLGYSRDELVGHNISKLMEPKIAREHDHYIYRYLLTGKAKIIGKPRVVRIVRKDQSVFEGQLNIVEVQGVENRGFLGAIIDVSHQCQMQRAAEETAKRAEQANLSKSRFLANMSHEIRTPLNGIMGALQLIGKKSLSVQQRLYLNTATESSQLLLSIITDVLDLAKIESEQFDLEYSPFDITKVIDTVVAGQKLLATEKNVTITLHYQDNFHQIWNGDATRVGQVVMNLVSNAIKFTEEGSIILSVGEFRDVSSDRSGIELELKDTGIGMSESTLAKLYQPFAQADSSSTRKQGGTGLGLAITKQIVDAMGGNIVVHSKLGLGTSVSVRLPLTHGEFSLDERPLSEATDELPNIAGARILIAEDNEINRLMVKNMLLDSNAKVVFATDGNMAVEAVRRVKPDVILMDIQMPEKDGVTATNEIRAAGFTMPIIAFTANVMKDDIRRYHENGFDEFLSKPVEINSLYRLISKVLPRN